MIKILCLIAFGAFAPSIYSYQVSANDGSVIDLAAFKGKKILIVNTASNSKYSSQYGDLEQLYQKFKDSLVIIAVPSNSFGNEPLSDTGILTWVNETYNPHYLLASKISVNGVDQSQLYAWLSNDSLNGVMSNGVLGDFHKFLVDGSGNLIGAFIGSVSPLDSGLINVISNQ